MILLLSKLGKEVEMEIIVLPHKPIPKHIQAMIENGWSELKELLNKFDRSYYNTFRE